MEETTYFHRTQYATVCTTIVRLPGAGIISHSKDDVVILNNMYQISCFTDVPGESSKK